MPRQLHLPKWHPLNPPKVAPFYPAANTPYDAVVFHDLFQGLVKPPESLVSSTARSIRVVTHSFAAFVAKPADATGTKAITACLRDPGTLGAPGDAGLILTDDDELAERVRYIRSETNAANEHQGRESGNFHQDTLQSAFLLEVLTDRLNGIRERAQRNGELLERIQALNLPGLKAPSGSEAIGNLVICVPRRDTLLDHLVNHGMQASVWWKSPLHRKSLLSG